MSEFTSAQEPAGVPEPNDSEAVTNELEKLPEEFSEEEVAPPPFVSVDSEIIRVISQLPELADFEYEGAMRLVFTTFVQHVEPAGLQPVSLEKAATDLEVMMDSSVGHVLEAVGDLASATAEIQMSLALEFEDITGRQVDPIDPDFHRVYMEERAEHGEKRARARDVIAAVTSISSALSIPNPDPGAKPDSPEEKRSSLASKLRNVGAKVIDIAEDQGLVTIPGKGPDEAEPVLGWLTEGILDFDSKGLTRLFWVLGEIQRLQDAAQVWSSLSNWNVDLNELTELMRMAATAARKEEDRSEQILPIVEQDYRDVIDRARSLEDLKEIFGAVDNFYQPG